MWLNWRIDPDSNAFNIPVAYCLTGALDVAALQSSWEAVSDRHESLRTVFLEGEDGQGMQRIDAKGEALLYEDCQGESSSAFEARVQGALGSGFSLTGSVPLRARLYRRGEQEYVLVLVLHHMIADGWSLDIVFRELVMQYRGQTLGEAVSLPALGVQYIDYAQWQLGRREGEQDSASRAYWREELAEVSRLSLPHTATEGEPGLGAVLAFEFDGGLGEQVEAYAVSRGGTAYMVLLGVYQLLLSRLSGESDILVGTTMANRGREELESVVGFFANVLGIRVEVDESQSFDALFSQVKDKSVSAFSHQGVSVYGAVEPALLSGGSGGRGLYQSTFVYQNTGSATGASQGSSGLPGVEVSAYAQGSQLTPYELMLEVEPGATGLHGRLTYRADLYGDDFVSALVSRYQALLSSVLSAPEVALWQHDVRVEQERARAQVKTSDFRCIGGDLSSAFSRAVALHGDKRALIGPDGEALSYAELDKQAGVMAGYLRARGIKPGSRVGVCLPRSSEAVLSILAVIKAGCTYVPLSPTTPLERLLEIFTASGLESVLVHSTLTEQLPAYELMFLDVLEVDGEAWREAKALSEPVARPRGTLAYVIYTSGSTGKPKGVAVPDEGVLRLVSETSYVDFESGLCIAQASNLAFDAATFEIWGSLLHGGSLSVVTKETLLKPEAFAAQAGRDDVDTVFLTTALFNLYAGQSPEVLSGMRYVLFGGEQVDAGAVGSQLSAGKPAHFLHVYGPTENTTYSTFHEIEADGVTGLTVPIGEALSNSSVHVYDGYLNEVADGVTGELYVGGAGLAQGYWQSPGQTASRFIPSPEGDGERLYRTGDMVRRDASGAIEFVGRQDKQIKLRGYRIELGEIESALYAVSQVRHACVRLSEEGPRQLVGYCAGEGLTREALWSHLRGRLPEYMIPASLVLLETMPLTANGKIDQGRLPAVTDQDRLSGTYQGPRNEIEQQMCEVWSQLLNVERVGIEDNFFDLGGDSLLAIQLKASLEERGVGMELPTLFEHPSIGQLSSKVQRVSGQEQGVAPFSLISEADRGLVPEGVEDMYPASRLQLGMLYHGQLAEGEDIYHEIISYRLRLPFEQAALQAAVDALIQRHEILRTGFDLVGFSEPMQLVYGQVELPLVVEDLRGQAAHTQDAYLDRWSREARQQRLVPEQAPLMRVYVHRLSDEVFQFTYSTHHSLWDGWSESLLTTELLTHYSRGLAGEPLAVSAAALPYRAFIALEQASLGTGESEAFWRDYLADGQVSALPKEGDGAEGQDRKSVV